MNAETRQRLLGKVSYQAALVGGVALLSSTLLSLADIMTAREIELRHDEDLKASLNQVIPTQLYDNDLLADSLTVDQQNLVNGKLKVFRASRDRKVQAVAYQTSVPGYAGPIVVLMAVDRDGTILGARVISHSETPGLGDKIETAKSDWILSFNGKSLRNPEPEQWAVRKDGGVFDQFTGATITPRRTIGAIHAGLEFFNDNKSLLLDEQANTGDAINRKQGE